MVCMWSASRTKQLQSLTRMFNTAASWALSSMTWHQMMMRCIPDLQILGTYHLNNDLPLFNYSMPSLPLSTIQVKNNTGLFSVPVDIHYTVVTFQPSRKNLSSYAPFPEAGFPHKNLIGFKVTSTSTSAHLKSHWLSVLLTQTLAKYLSCTGNSCSLCITHMPTYTEVPCFIFKYLSSVCYWWFHKMTCNKLLRNTAAAVNHCTQMNKECIQLPISKGSKISYTVKGSTEAIKFSECG